MPTLFEIDFLILINSPPGSEPYLFMRHSGFRWNASHFEAVVAEHRRLRTLMCNTPMKTAVPDFADFIVATERWRY